MKTNAIVRILLFSLAILILLGILVAGLSYNALSSFFRTEESVPSAHGQIPSSSVSGEIHQLKIQWAVGTITIQPGDTDQILLQETQVDEPSHQMVIKENGRSLTIQFCESAHRRFSFPSFGQDVNFSKDLTVTFPRDWTLDTLEIEAASAEVVIRDLTIHEVDFDGASGECTFENCHVDELDIDTASGDIQYFGSLTSLECDAASASFTAVLSNTPAHIDMDTMSGDIDITLPEDCGFCVSIDSMSSDFYSDFPTTIKNGSYVYGNGACRIDVNAMSGDVRIRKAA